MDNLRTGVLNVFLGFFFHHLYTTFAQAYDFTAWIVSAGQWHNWQMVGVEAVPNGRILELGHGSGHLLKILAQQGRNVVGLDLSPQMCRLATHRLQHAGLPKKVIRARAQALPFANERFDGVLSTFPTEYIFDTQTLEEVYRVLRPGGSLVVISAVNITIGSSVQTRFLAWLYQITGQSGNSYANWIEPFEKAGFSAYLDVVPRPPADVWRIIALKNLWSKPN